MNSMKIEKGVALIRLEGGKANAMSPEFLNSIAESIDEFEQSHATAGVLTGYEKFFSAGLALPTLVSFSREQLRQFMLGFTGVMLKVFFCPKPIIAAINGHAVAGGCVLALQCDYRVMAEGKYKIGLNETQLGIGLPVVVLETLKLQVPPASMVQIALQGSLFTPQEAQKIGLVHEVVHADELISRGRQMAEALGSNPLSGISQVKRAMRYPAAELIQRTTQEDLEAWLDTWFSPEAQERIGETVQRLQGS